MLEISISFCFSVGGRHINLFIKENNLSVHFFSSHEVANIYPLKEVKNSP